MRLWRSRGGRAALGVVALGVGLTLFVVLPAVASTPGDYVALPSGQHVLPLDLPIGGTGDCANLFPGGFGRTYSEYDNVNPKNASNLPSGNNDGATFSLSLSGDSKHQTLAVTATGAEILGIGIKGGTQSTAYDYVHGPYVTGDYPFTLSSGSNPTSVTADTGLHAPAQNFSTMFSSGIGNVESPSQYYSISQLNVCYAQGSVGGTVYEDLNSNGSYDSGTDTTLAGWTMHLYKGPTLVGTATSDANGVYKLGAVFDGSTYTVCEVPNPSTPFPAGMDAWAQTEPGSGSATCSGAGELKRGWSFTTANPLDNVTRNFGNVGAITCTGGPFGIPGYQVGTCKPGQTYVFSSGTVSGTVSGTTQPYVSYWVGDPTQQSRPTVEKITFPDPWGANGPTLTQILYEDANGFQAPTATAPPMPYCNVDPRDTSSATGYPESYTLQSTLPAGILPAGASSCLISLKITAPADGSANGTLVAYVYSTTDSFRVGA